MYTVKCPARRAIKGLPPLRSESAPPIRISAGPFPAFSKAILVPSGDTTMSAMDLLVAGFCGSVGCAVKAVPAAASSRSNDIRTSLIETFTFVAHASWIHFENQCSPRGLHCYTDHDTGGGFLRSDSYGFFPSCSARNWRKRAHAAD